nr:MAG TPA: hypothetical protein [Caudoviricetes sp.]
MVPLVPVQTFRWYCNGNPGTKFWYHLVPGTTFWYRSPALACRN